MAAERIARRVNPTSIPLRPDRISPALITLWSDGAPLLILALTLLYASRLLTIGEEEALALNSAAQPLRTILAQFHSGLSLEGSPVLYNIVLHYWLLLTGGALPWLRVPSALFFIAGLWTLSRGARYGWGAESATTLLLLGALWPYAFHYGGSAAGYSFLFFLVSAITWAYLRFSATPNLTAWAAVCFLALVLLYTTYFGWFVIILLSVDDFLRNRGTQHPAGRRLLGTLALLAVAYAPLWPTVVRDVPRVASAHSSWLFLLVNASYNAYVLLASESVAPWFWRFGVPVMLAVASGFVLLWLGLRGQARRFFIFGGLLVVTMDLLGLLQPRQLLLVAPWVLLPISVALCTIQNRYQQRALAVCLIIVAGMGWYGIYTGRYYATADFRDPWPSVAAEAAGAVRQGAGVISNSPSFFLYLTYALREPGSASPRGFPGFLPATLRHPQIWAADSWIAAGQPVLPGMLLVRSLTPTSPVSSSGSSSSTSPSSAGAGPMDEAAKLLDHRCGERVNRYVARDPSYVWKQRLFPQVNAVPWRVEIHQYTCDQQSGKQ